MATRRTTMRSRGLRHLRDQRLHIAQQDVQHRSGSVEFPLQRLRRQAIAIASTLHHGPIGRGLAAHEQRDAGIASFPTTAISADAPSAKT